MSVLVGIGNTRGHFVSESRADSKSLPPCAFHEGHGAIAVPPSAPLGVSNPQAGGVEARLMASLLHVLVELARCREECTVQGWCSKPIPSVDKGIWDPQCLLVLLLT